MADSHYDSQKTTKRERCGERCVCSCYRTLHLYVYLIYPAQVRRKNFDSLVSFPRLTISVLAEVVCTPIVAVQTQRDIHYTGEFQSSQDTTTASATMTAAETRSSQRVYSAAMKFLCCRLISLSCCCCFQFLPSVGIERFAGVKHHCVPLICPPLQVYTNELSYIRWLSEEESS